MPLVPVGLYGRRAVRRISPWAGYSSALATLLSEAQSSGLVLDFAQNLAFRAGTSSTIAGVSGWTYTRTGTAYDLAGTTSFGANVPRRTSAGLLVEAGATNLLTYSQDFSNAAWGHLAVVTTGAAAAPDGTTTANQIAFAAGVATDAIKYWITGSTTLSATTHTFSVWVRTLTGTATLGLRVTGAAASATVSTTVSINTTWQRVSIQFTGSGVGGSLEVGFDQRTSIVPGVTNPLTALFWGAQLETGSVATSYIPTTATSASRGADAASVTFTQALPYSVVAEFFLPSPTGSARIVGVNGTANTALQIQSTTSVSNFNGSGAVTSPSSSSMANRIVRAGSAHATGDLAITLDGLSPSTGTFNNADLTSVNLGSQGGTSNFMNGNLRLLAILPRRITNTELQNATA